MSMADTTPDNLRVLHVMSSIDRRAGGPVAALAGLARAQLACGLRVSICASFGAGDDLALADELRRDGAEVHTVGPTGRFGRHPELAGTLARLVGACDIVHIHALWEQIQHQAAAAARAAGVPYIFRPCGMLDPWSLAQSKWKKRLYMLLRLRRDLDRAAALHFTSATEMDLTRPLNLRSPGIVEPNGVDLAEFESLPPRGAFRSRHPAIGERPIVLFLSRVHPKKGLDLLIPAFARSALDDAVLVIAGPAEDNHDAAVREMARRQGVADRVLLVGMLKGRDRVEALVDAELFTLPSYQENFGVAVVEALAAGLPVLISDQVNIHREISAARVGGVVPAQVQPLADELRRWMRDTSLRRAAAERARPFVREHYDWRMIAARWAGRYRQLIA